MTSRSEMMKENNAQIIRNDQSPPNFRNLVNLENTIDDIRTLSSILSRVFTIQDLRSYYLCKVCDIGYFEIR